MPYNIPFIKNSINCNLPHYINWDLLFNVAYCLNTEQVKLYFVADEKSFLYKCTTDGEISKQYDVLKVKVDIERLDRFLSYRLNYDDLILDTVEDDIYYVYCEESGFEQTIRMIEILAEKFSISAEDLFKAVSLINGKKIDRYHQIFDCMAVSMVKIPVQNDNFKIYARPYKTGNDFPLDGKLQEFLRNVYGCEKSELMDHIKNMWVSYNFSTGQVTVSTQDDELKRSVVG